MKSFSELLAGLDGSYAGWITVADREWLCEFLQRRYLDSDRSPPTILEIGAFMGSTTNLMVLSSGGRAIVVDDWSGGPHPNFATLRDGLIHHTTQSGFYPGRIEIVDGTSRSVGASWNRQVDLVYVDADHSYEGCRDDLALFAKWATDVVLVDDYDIEAVRRATDEWFAGGGWKLVRRPNITNQEKLFACERIR